MKNSILPIFLATVWITCSEFLRNEILFKELWVERFQSLGLTFQTLPINGILWTVWSFLLALIIFKLLQKYSWQETLLFSWIPSFLMMWITIYNLQVLPLPLLAVAFPLSLVEVGVAIAILQFFKKKI